MSKCPDCHAEMLTYSQHLKDGCQIAQERHLLGRDLPDRTIAGVKRDKKMTPFHSKKRSATLERQVKEGDPNRAKGKPGRPKTRLMGTPQKRDPNKPCSKCKAAKREKGDTYCLPCRRQIGREWRAAYRAKWKKLK